MCVHTGLYVKSFEKDAEHMGTADDAQIVSLVPVTDGQVSLKIGNNERLKTIEIEDGERWQENEKWYQNGALYYVKSVSVESI